MDSYQGTKLACNSSDSVLNLALKRFYDSHMAVPRLRNTNVIQYCVYHYKLCRPPLNFLANDTIGIKQCKLELFVCAGGTFLPKGKKK